MYISRIFGVPCKFAKYEKRAMTRGKKSGVARNRAIKYFQGGFFQIEIFDMTTDKCVWGRHIFRIFEKNLTSKFAIRAKLVRLRCISL